MRVGIRVRFLFFPPFLSFFAKTFSHLYSSVSSPMARTKTTANPPPLSINYRDLYSWAPVELLDECSSLVSTKVWRDHVEEPCTYNHRAFGKRHDDEIAVLPCTLGELVCGDERANNGVPFFYFYQVVFKRIEMRLSFSRFERELLTEINIAPAQLHPIGWAFVKAFGVLCGFLHFFEVKKQGKSLWVSLSNIPGRVLLSLFQ